MISRVGLIYFPDQQKALKEMLRVLKPGGELYFSDVFSSRRIPLDLKQDKVFIGECLGGSLYTEDFRRLLVQLGCHDYRMTARSTIDLLSEEIKQKAGLIEFYSMTVRAFPSRSRRAANSPSC